MFHSRSEPNTYIASTQLFDFFLIKVKKMYSTIYTGTRWKLVVQLLEHIKRHQIATGSTINFESAFKPAGLASNNLYMYISQKSLECWGTGYLFEHNIEMSQLSSELYSN